MNTTFSQLYEQLNKQQRAAVDQIEGPLLVVAGPGTGKTQLLSVRVAQILKQTDSKPANVLCLTYTEKAAQEMKQRLLEVIGVEARKVVVKTFHGLGVELINSHPEQFFSGAQLVPAPEAVELEIIEQVLEGRSHDDSYALKFMGEFTMADRARRHIARAKKAGLTPAKLRAVASHNIEYLQSLLPEWQPVLDQRMSKKLFPEYQQLVEDLNPDSMPQLTPLRSIGEHLKSSLELALAKAVEADATSPLSEWKSEWTEKIGNNRTFKDIKRSQRMLDLSEVYAEFQDEMFSRGYYDFDDMIIEVITKLEQDADFRAAVQERFTHILLDEFQDTNDAQFRLSYLIASHEAQSGRPNIMAVGDDDQAIYRFQGAELSNIDNFSKSFVDTNEIVLTQNYRSTQSIIDDAAQTAELINHRLVDIRPGLSKDLTQANLTVSEGQIKHISYPTEIEHITGIAKQAKAELETGKSVAVLARSHAPLEQLAGALHRLEVPVQYKKRNDVLRHPAVLIYTQILELIVAINQHNQSKVNELLVDIIGHPMFGLDSSKLWKFGVKCRESRARDWLGELSTTETTQFKQLANWLTELAQQAHQEPAAVISDYILGLRELAGFTSPLRNYFLNEDKQLYLESLSAIQKLRSLITEFRRDRSPDVNDWVDFVLMHRAHHVQITDESEFISSERAVELLSVHSAKGLEFDQVFIIDATDKTWSPRGARFRPPANLESMRAPGDSDDDYARLMYVAITRAKSDLTIASYSTDEHGKEVLPTPLVSHLPTTVEETNYDQLIETVETGLRWPQPPLRSQQELLAPILEKYQLPVTHLLNFIDVTDNGPTKFIERNLLRLPSVKTAHMAYGTAVHKALESAQQAVNRGEGYIEVAKDEFEQNLLSQQLPTADEAQYLGRGLQLLDSLLTSDWFKLKSGVQPERTVFDVNLKSGAVIQGKFDAVEVEQNQVTITDYKTGSSLSRLDTYSKREGVKALKHKLQLDFYSLLAQESGMADNKTVIGKMIYVEADNSAQAELTHQSSSADIALMKQLVGAIWQRIMNHDWPKVSQYDDNRQGMEQFITDLVDA